MKDLSDMVIDKFFGQSAYRGADGVLNWEWWVLSCGNLVTASYDNPRYRTKSVYRNGPVLREKTKEMQPDRERRRDPNCTITIYAGSDTGKRSRVVGFISEWINAYTFLSRKYLF